MQVHRETRLVLGPLHELRLRLVEAEVSRLEMRDLPLYVGRDADALGLCEGCVGVERDPVPTQRESPGIIDVNVKRIELWRNSGMWKGVPNRFRQGSAGGSAHTWTRASGRQGLRPYTKLCGRNLSESEAPVRCVSDEKDEELLVLRARAGSSTAAAGLGCLFTSTSIGDGAPMGTGKSACS